jgi:protoheme IX farnesyltransferase
VKTDTLVWSARSTRAVDWLVLTKPRLNSLVVATAAVGYAIAESPAADPLRFLWTIVGTALVAGGAAAFNQVYERDTDRLMRRTRNRPLADGRIQPAEACFFGATLTLVGLIQLARETSGLAAAVAAATLVSYAGVYTPLKRRTPLATLVGAVPGALPPVIGWTAARGTVSPEAWTLFAIVFFWQIPHFLSLAWLYRDEFAAAGVPLLPVLEPKGRRTGQAVLVCSAVLLPTSLLPAAVGLAGAAYVAASGVLGTMFLALSVWFAARRTAAAARAVFTASLLYLPALWVLLLGLPRP